MPLDQQNGELIKDLGSMYRIVPKEKWMRTPMFEEARIAAHEAFRRSAGKFINSKTPALPLTLKNFIVQEYPLTDKLLFLFCETIDGEEQYYPYTFDLPKDLVSQLHVEGMWSYEMPRKLN